MNNLSNERLKKIRSETFAETARGANASVEVNASLLVAVLDELLALREAQAGLISKIRFAHDTLIEINPNNYTHDDVCEINAASVEVILSLAPTLGENHGKTEQWWALREAGKEPVAWVRYRSDGGIEGPIMNSAIEECRKATWTPLYAAPQLPAVPNGWVMVPAEPTLEMVEATEGIYHMKGIYAALIAAAPKPEVK